MELDEDLRLNRTLQRSLDDAPIGLCYVDADLCFVHVNEWLAKMNGLSVEAHLGKTLREVLPHVADGVEPQFRQVIDSGEPIIAGTVEAETAAQPGVKHWYEHYYYPDVGAEGAVVGVSCVVLDITERMAAEEDLRNSHSLLSQAEELSSTGAWQWDVRKDEWTFSDEWLAIHGCHDRHLTSAELLTVAHHEDRERIAEAFEHVSTGLGPYDIEHRIVRQDTGDIRIVHARGKLVRDEAGAEPVNPDETLGDRQLVSILLA